MIITEGYVGKLILTSRKSTTSVRQRQNQDEHFKSSPAQSTDRKQGIQKIKFLRDIYTSPLKVTKWNQISSKDFQTAFRKKMPTLTDLQQDIQLITETQPLDLFNEKVGEDGSQPPQTSGTMRKFRFEKKLQYNEVYRDLLAKSSTNFLKTFQRPLSPMLQRGTSRKQGKLGNQPQSDQRIIPPPLGYYKTENANDFKRRQPMFVFMHERSLSQPQVLNQLQSEVPLLASNSRAELERSTSKDAILRNKKQKDQREMVELISNLQQVGTEKLKRKQELERKAMNEKTKYLPKPTQFDPACFIAFTQNIDGMKKKLRSLRQELNTWTDKQVNVFKKTA